MNETPPTPWQQRQHIMEMLNGYRRSQILITCSELGVFTALAEGPLSVSQLASRLGASDTGLERLLNAAAALGLLEKHGELFSNSAAAQTCLTGKGDFSIHNFARREGAFYRRWAGLTQAVLTGQRPEDNRSDEDPEEWVRSFEYALYDLARPTAPLVAQALALPEDRPLHVLDVGGGHGGYSLALAQRYPRLKATVLELPRVVPVAREIIATAGLSDRVDAQVGNFQEDDLGSGYDLALLFGVLSGDPPERRAGLILRVYQALKPGGQIAVRENLLTPDLTSPPEAAIFSLQMLLATDSGGASTRRELEGWLQSAGFLPPKVLPLPEDAGSTILVAEKPGDGR